MQGERRGYRRTCVQVKISTDHRSENENTRYGDAFAPGLRQTDTEGLDCFTEWTEKGYRLVAAREGTDWNLPPLAINVERTKSK
jgi:hypothetical protein